VGFKAAGEKEGGEGTREDLDAEKRGEAEGSGRGEFQKEQAEAGSRLGAGAGGAWRSLRELDGPRAVEGVPPQVKDEDGNLRPQVDARGVSWRRREEAWRRLNDERAAAALLPTANGPGYTLTSYPVRPWECDAEGNPRPTN
jgi:hypothetical protein